ncbi:MAG TPA: hypothetical protein VJA66_04545, partial [Thermoanaerobaculia bacterium]
MNEPKRDLTSFLVGALLTLASLSSPAAAQTATDSTTCDACIDIAIGNDGNARLLQWDAVTQRVSFETVDGSGVVTRIGPFGPFSGWTPRAIASGADSLTRVLWAHEDGSSALWLVAPLGVASAFRFPSTPGLAAVDVAAAANSETHILSVRADGAAVVQAVDASGAVARTLPFGPYPGWLATAISDGPDGLTRILWNNADGRVGLSKLSTDGSLATTRYAAEEGWTALDVAVGGDGLTRILRAKGDGSVNLWIVGAADELVTSANFTTPGGMAPRRLAAGANGSSQILFTGGGGQAALWAMTPEGAYQQSSNFKATPPSEGTSSWDVVLEVTANSGSGFCINTPGVGMTFETTYQIQRNGDSVFFLHPDDPIDWSTYTATLSGGNFAA